MNLRNLVTGTVTVMALGASGIAVAGIDDSPHDLDSLNADDNGEICVYCHTPHGASSATESPPLWNKALPDGTGYTRYSSTQSATLDGAEADVGSVSLACLSCHDGVQAMDSVINAPGSAGTNPSTYNATGAVMGGGLGSQMSGSPVPMLSTDLSDDHPISIEYAGGACTDMAVGTTVSTCDPSTATDGDPDFQVVQAQQINQVNQYWVDVASGENYEGAITGVAAGTRNKTDMILYGRDFNGASAGGNGPSVECGSCHDPHEGKPAGSTIAEVNFLRIRNVNSAVCLACHIK